MTVGESAFFQRLERRFKRGFQDALAQRLLKNSSWMVGGQLGAAVLGMLQVALLSRTLGKDAYGGLVLISTAALTVRQLLSVRVWEWTTKDFTHALEHRDASRAAFVIKSGLMTSAIVNGLAFLLLAAVSPLVEVQFLKGHASAALVIAFGGTFVGSFAYDTCFAALRAAGLFRYLSLQGLVVALARVIVLGATAVTSHALGSVVYAYVAFELTAGVWILAKTSRVFTQLFGTPFWRLQTPSFLGALRHNKRLLLFGSMLDTLKLATARVDILLLGYLATPAAVAVYQAAYNFVDAINRLAAPVSLVTFSELSRSAAHGDGAAFMQTARRMSFWGLGAGAILVPTLFVGAPWFVGLVYGADFAESVPVLRALAVTLLWFTVIWMQPAFASAGKSHWGLQVTGVSITLKLVLLALLVPPFGAFGLGLTNAIYYLIPLALMPLYLARLKNLVMAPSFKQHAPAWGAAS
jgi:O-antigen/teichoic acid export membrane protein